MGRPRERREAGEQDLFRARRDQILNMNHELVRLARTIDWPVVEARFGEVYCDGPGMPPLRDHAAWLLQNRGADILRLNASMSCR